MSTEALVRNILLGDMGLSPCVVERGGLLAEDGLDSLDRLRLLEILEQRFGIAIVWSHLSYDRFDTIQDIARTIDSILAREAMQAGGTGAADDLRRTLRDA